MSNRGFRDFAVPLSLSLALLLPRSAAAAWPTDPLVNVPLCTAANDQQFPTTASDGLGGAIVTWSDKRSGTSNDIYVRRVRANGDLDPAWPTDGRALCTAANDQLSPAIVSDGSGGAIVTWYDDRNGTSNDDIYAQRVLASGAVDPAWPTNGRALCTAANIQELPKIVSDGAGGAIVTWSDYRSGTNNDVYAQHVLAGGAVDPAWPADGRALCTAANHQQSPVITSDGQGGAIVGWADSRAGGNDIYAQRVLASGAVDPVWPVNGRILCAAANNQRLPKIVSDGSGGAIVTWADLRNHTDDDVFVQRVLASGTVDPAWPADGRALCVAANHQQFPAIVSDGGGGAIVTWYDDRSGGNSDIYAQRVLASGAVDSGWPADGRALSLAPGSQSFATIVSDGAGGAIVTWTDLRSGSNNDIYAQRVLGSGIADPAWPTDGRALCTAAGDQWFSTILSDGSGGAIVAWYDYRGGETSDIYAQRVRANGQLGGDVVSVPGEISHLVSLDPARPNPTRGGALMMHFTLASAAGASLELFDVTGRRIVRREVGSLGAGHHALDLASDRRLAPGLYLVRLAQGTSMRVTRVAVLDRL